MAVPTRLRLRLKFEDLDVNSIVNNYVKEEGGRRMILLPELGHSVSGVPGSRPCHADYVSTGLDDVVSELGPSGTRPVGHPSYPEPDTPHI